MHSDIDTFFRSFARSQGAHVHFEVFASITHFKIINGMAVCSFSLSLSLFLAQLDLDALFLAVVVDESYENGIIYQAKI